MHSGRNTVCAKSEKRGTPGSQQQRHRAGSQDTGNLFLESFRSPATTWITMAANSIRGTPTGLPAASANPAAKSTSPAEAITDTVQLSTGVQAAAILNPQETILDEIDTHRKPSFRNRNHRSGTSTCTGPESIGPRLSSDLPFLSVPLFRCVPLYSSTRTFIPEVSIVRSRLRTIPNPK